MDSCLTNLANAYRLYKIKTAIVLFPVMNRKLLKFGKKDLFFQMPVGPHSEWPYDEFISQNYFSRQFIKDMISKTRKEITNDLDQQYSKQKILLVKDFCSENDIKLFVSSWDQLTMKFLEKNHDFNLLPLYDMTVTKERAVDNEHPCEAHNIDWVSKIATSIL